MEEMLALIQASAELQLQPLKLDIQKVKLYAECATLVDILNKTNLNIEEVKDFLQRMNEPKAEKSA